MKFYWRLRKENNYFNALNLINLIPELKKCTGEYIEDYLRSSNLEFYYKEKVKTPFWIRLTLPFALISMLFLLIMLPLNYIITGYWGYRWLWLSNWFRSLGF